MKGKIRCEFVITELGGSVKFKRRSVYCEINNAVNSRLDVVVVTDKGDTIADSVGDVSQKIYKLRYR